MLWTDFLRLKYGGSDSKESSCSAGHLGSIPGLERPPGGGHGNPLQYSCLENPHGQRSLAGYSPWGRKELDITERLSTHTQVIYNVLFSAIQQSESIIHKYIHSFLYSLPLSYHRMLNVFPCATQYDLTVYPFYI